MADKWQREKRDVLYNRILKNSIRNPFMRKLSPHIFYRGCPGSFSHPFWTETATASITVEAAWIVPFLFLSLLSFCFLFSVVKTQNRIQLELEQAACQYASYGTKISSIGTLFREQVLIRWDEGEPDPVCYVNYSRKIPFVKYIGAPAVYQQIRISSYQGRSMAAEDDGEGAETVFVTDQGTVYHSDPYCTYLKPKIETVAGGEIVDRRNRSGGKYYACSFCCGENNGAGREVYITAYGDRYHQDKKCFQLYHKVREVPLSEIGAMRPCSKCTAQ